MAKKSKGKKSGGGRQGEGKSYGKVVILIAALLLAAAVPVAWLTLRVPTLGGGQIDAVWLVEGGAPRAVVFTKHHEARDFLRMSIVDVDTGKKRGQMDLGKTSGGNDIRVFGPAGDLAWLWSKTLGTRPDGLYLLSLQDATVQKDPAALLAKLGGQVGGDLRVETSGLRFDYDQGLLKVQGKNGKHFDLAADLSLKESKENAYSTKIYQKCRPILTKVTAAESLQKPSLRGCPARDGFPIYGLVQHSAAFGEAENQATAFDSEGKVLWTKTVADIVGAPGWVGDSGPKGQQLVVLAVTDDGLIAATVDANTGTRASAKPIF